MKLKALLVDDEYPARQELRYALAQIEDIEVVGEAAGAPEALHLLQSLDYSVVFLDIQMPGLNGLALSRVLGKLKNPPRVIFVTAYEEYAVTAFEVDAVDYILKPVEVNRLRKAVERVKALAGNDGRTDPPSGPGEGQKHYSRLPVELSGRTFLVDLTNIAYVYSENESVYCRIGRDSYLTRLTMRAMEQRLGSQDFFRVHRCYIVNLRQVKEIVPYFNGAYSLIMDDAADTEIPVSRNRVKKLRSLLGF